MNKQFKRLLLGFLVWLIPFFASFFVWDIESNSPSVSMELFGSLMAFFWALGFSIAIYYWFKDKSNHSIRSGIETGLIWYVEMLFLDLIFLVLLFGMDFSNYLMMFITYSNTLLITSSIGFILSKK